MSCLSPHNFDRDTIIRESKACIFDAIGFAPDISFNDLAFFYAQNHEYMLPQAQKHLEPFNPFHGKSQIKSFVVGLFKSNCPLESENNNRRDSGTISIMAQERDYHLYVMERLNQFKHYLEEQCPNNLFECYTDSIHFNDKYIAIKARLGKIGHNSLLIHPELGSQVFIGYIATDICFDEWPKVIADDFELICDKCGLCQKNCPTNALGNPKILNTSRCISHLTQKKGELTEQEIKWVQGHVFGCDICQYSCPYNRIKQVKNFHPDQNLIINHEYSLLELLYMNKSEFNEGMKITAGGYLGLNHYKRLAAYMVRHTEDTLYWIDQLELLLPLQQSDKVKMVMKKTLELLKARGR